MPGKRDYYAILSVQHDADEAEIKSAYRKLAMQHHPDRNPDDPHAVERFKEAAEAFEVLSDPQKRRLYDRHGHDGPQGAGFSGFTNTEEIFEHFSEMFGEMFGFARHRAAAPQRGNDIRVELTLELTDVLADAEHEITIQTKERCRDCNGTGARAGTSVRPCSQCNGKGSIYGRQGGFMLERKCPACNGEGQVIRAKCRECAGTGNAERPTTLAITVPAGVDDGQTLRIQGRGLPGVRGGPPGNLYVVIRLAPDPLFVRDGADVHSSLRISIFQAALGCKGPIQTFEGVEQLDLHAGTQHGETFVRRGKGFPILAGHGRGDLHVHIEVVVPDDLSDEHRALLHEIAVARHEAVASPDPSVLHVAGRRKRNG